MSTEKDSKRDAESKPKAEAPRLTVRGVTRAPDGYVCTTYAVPADVLAKYATGSFSDTRPRVISKMGREIDREHR
jgi:hypothetical protein